MVQISVRNLEKLIKICVFSIAVMEITCACSANQATPQIAKTTEPEFTAEKPTSTTESNTTAATPTPTPQLQENTSDISFEKSPQTFASIPTWQIGLADFDSDGDLDAAFANSQANYSQVWLNDGRGTFFATDQELGMYGHGLAVGDLNNDGILDLAITTHEYTPTRIYLNNGNAFFEKVENAFSETIGHSIKLYDLDSDGDLDAVGELGGGDTSVYWNDGLGHFIDSELSFPNTTVWGDLDSDQDIDVLIKENNAGYSVYLNDGSGSFNLHWNLDDPEAMENGDMALGDLDKDGDQDVIITNGFRQTSYPTVILLNDGSGRFTDSGQALSAVTNAGVSLGDLDNDGDLDIVLTDYMNPCQIWLNDGSGNFSDSGFRFGDEQFYRHAHLGDLDNDGDLDIFLATFGMSQGPNEIWFNQHND
jgi:hypothetical protein